MIVWLASYPRSGNTLLRTIFSKTMQLASASDEVGEAKIFGLSDEALRAAGILDINDDWANFYQRAMSSNEIFLVKTHRLPRDDQPAIYVVRDGRKTLLSYSRFHQRFSPTPYPSLLDLVLGADYYGGWADHVRAWMGRPNTMVVRFEELVAGSENLLKQLSRVVRYSKDLVPWKNPFDEFREENPAFFRSGEICWRGDPDWSSLINSLFFNINGDLMTRLGYASFAECEEAAKHLTVEHLALIETSRRYLSEMKKLENICGQRQLVIDELKRTCDERLLLLQSVRS
jgi:hypothetical protein